MNVKTPVARIPTPPFYTSIACWIDLLGYGRMISRARFSPVDPEAASAIKRLRRFHRLVAEHSSSRFPTFVTNDGAVAYRDLSYLDNKRTLPFLENAFRLFEAVNKERDDDLPGARMVIATGFRMKGRRPGGANEAARRRGLVESVRNGERTVEQAVESAARGGVYIDVVPQLQANFAFTAAYLAEQSGRRGGLPGPICYLDMSLFDHAPRGISLGPVISWRHGDLDLSRDFAPLLGIDPSEVSDSHQSGVKTGFGVARHLAQEADVATALQSYFDKVAATGRNEQPSGSDSVSGG